MGTAVVITGHRSFQGSLTTMHDLIEAGKHKPPAAQLAIDEQIAYHKAVRDFNSKNTSAENVQEKPPKKVRKNR